jgi:hypothetical protein
MMRILLMFLYGIAIYKLWWIVFTALVFCAARFTPRSCLPLWFVLLTFLICHLDAAFVRIEMEKPDWDGMPDLDMIFMFGVLARTVLVCLILTPVALLGFRLRKRSRGVVPESAPPWDN